MLPTPIGFEFDASGMHVVDRLIDGSPGRMLGWIPAPLKIRAHPTQAPQHTLKQAAGALVFLDVQTSV
jgi:hypothetical protein